MGIVYVNEWKFLNQPKFSWTIVSFIEKSMKNKRTIYRSFRENKNYCFLKTNEK